MADQSDVENALRDAVGAVLFPSGAASVTGDKIIVVRGWPNPAELQTALASKSVTVSIFPDPSGRRTTRFADREVEIPTPVTITGTVAGQVVTFGGTPSSGQVVAVMIGHVGTTYRCKSNDTPTSVADGLSRAVGGFSLGPRWTMPGLIVPVVTFYADAVTLIETRRQQQFFMVTIWAPTPLQRDAVASAIDAPLSAVDFLPLPDGNCGRLLFERTRPFDISETETMYRRNLIYSVEYATTLRTVTPRMAVPVLGYTVNSPH